MWIYETNSSDEREDFRDARYKREIEDTAPAMNIGRKGGEVGINEGRIPGPLSVSGQDAGIYTAKGQGNGSERAFGLENDTIFGE